MRSKKYIPIPDAPTLDECKEVALGLDFPGDITDIYIAQVVTTFLDGRELLPDLLPLK